MMKRSVPALLIKELAYEICIIYGGPRGIRPGPCGMRPGKPGKFLLWNARTPSVGSRHREAPRVCAKRLWINPSCEPEGPEDCTLIDFPKRGSNSIPTWSRGSTDERIDDRSSFRGGGGGSLEIIPATSSEAKSGQEVVECQS